MQRFEVIQANTWIAVLAVIASQRRGNCSDDLFRHCEERSDAAIHVADS